MCASIILAKMVVPVFKSLKDPDIDADVRVLDFTASVATKVSLYIL